MTKFILCFALFAVSCQNPSEPILSQDVISRWMFSSDEFINSYCSDTINVRLMRRFLRNLNDTNKREEVFLKLDQYFRKNDSDLIVVENFNRNYNLYSIQCHKMSDTVIFTFDFDFMAATMKTDTILYGDNSNWATLCSFVSKNGSCCADISRESNPSLSVNTIFKFQDQKIKIHEVCVYLD